MSGRKTVANEQGGHCADLPVFGSVFKRLDRSPSLIPEKPFDTTESVNQCIRIR